MPHVTIKLFPGKTEQQKSRLAQKIAEEVVRILESEDKSVSIAFEEVDADAWRAKVYEPEILGKPAQLYKKPGYTM